MTSVFKPVRFDELVASCYSKQPSESGKRKRSDRPGRNPMSDKAFIKDSYEKCSIVPNTRPCTPSRLYFLKWHACPHLSKYLLQLEPSPSLQLGRTGWAHRSIDVLHIYIRESMISQLYMLLWLSTLSDTPSTETKRYSLKYFTSKYYSPQPDANLSMSRPGPTRGSTADISHAKPYLDREIHEEQLNTKGNEIVPCFCLLK